MDLRTVDTGKIEDEIALSAPQIEFLGRGIDIVFIDGFYRLRQVVPLGLAIKDILELSTQVPSNKTFSSSNENFHLYDVFC